MGQNKKPRSIESRQKKIYRRQSSGSDAAAQRNRILEYLRLHGSLTTLQARSLLDTLHPAARVQELRDAGHNIATVWVFDETPEGRSHRVARYHLMREVAR